MDLAFSEWSDPFAAEQNPASLETTLKGLITSWWSQPLSSAPPTISWCLRNTRTQRGSLWVRQESIGPVALARGRGRSRRQLVCLVIICDQAFDMRQFLVEVFTPLLLFPITRELLKWNKGGPWLPKMNDSAPPKWLFSPLFTHTLTELQQEALCFK